jgi:ribosomal protein S27AE
MSAEGDRLFALFRDEELVNLLTALVRDRQAGADPAVVDDRLARVHAEFRRRGRPAYACPRCGAVSFLSHDLAHNSCGWCHAFEDG